MPRGQCSTGHWNFHVKRYKCIKCGKKGMYMHGLSGWIICMYCKFLASDAWYDHVDRDEAKQAMKEQNNIENEKS